MASTTEAVALALQRLEEAKKPFLAGEANSTDAVLDAARAILLAGGREQDRALVSPSSKKEKASDFMQRVMWAEVRTAIRRLLDLSSLADSHPQSVMSPLLAVAVQIELFQKLRDAGTAGVSTDALSIR